MAVRGEEVATSIEAHVRESIDKMVAEIRSSIEDVREVVDSQLKAALQSVQADVNSITFLPHIQKSIGELEESFKPEPVEMPAPQVVAGGPDASRVKRSSSTILPPARVVTRMSWALASNSCVVSTPPSAVRVTSPLDGSRVSTSGPTLVPRRIASG